MKCWFVLREDITYTSKQLMEITSEMVLKPFHEMHIYNNENIRKAWEMSGNKFNTYFIYNMDYLIKLEDYLLNEGIIFKWIYKNKTPVGVFIEPTNINLRDDILSSCMNMDEFTKYRQRQFDELNPKIL